ncbi:MAG: hypothetical protein GTO45_26400 [Candidatus Aminicenantes bacterium]|nr:hypothetical protein [Candidatus Aminicenantes bacterium]NIM82406.1 hypothetical protein [Candidatus Aminicenantes bacterium]NIN21954.1 hypothetical protein [Candidatus Aminicenantes bacterium]NIN45470.1 hypothetical protein [Candidatus Aminicenantes bacterium]NIN88301.1 hypothetical protein [Candidatus Aminicenantes bacterium]
MFHKFGALEWQGEIAHFLLQFAKILNPKHEIRNPKQIQMTKIQNSKQEQKWKK